MAMADRRVVMLSAGEASGDLHGETLCRALRALEPDASLVCTVFPFGLGFSEPVLAPGGYPGPPRWAGLPGDRPGGGGGGPRGPDPAVSLSGLLPGSRRKEGARLLPAMLEAAGKLAAGDPR